MKTLSVGVIMCLNLGVPPPDSQGSPGGRLECWIGEQVVPGGEREGRILIRGSMGYFIPRSEYDATSKGLGRHWQQNC